MLGYGTDVAQLFHGVVVYRCERDNLVPLAGHCMRQHALGSVSNVLIHASEGAILAHNRASQRKVVMVYLATALVSTLATASCQASDKLVSMVSATVSDASSAFKF